MGSRQLPFEFIDDSYYDLTDRENELLNYFTEIEDSNIQKTLIIQHAQFFSWDDPFPFEDSDS